MVAFLIAGWSGVTVIHDDASFLPGRDITVSVGNGVERKTSIDHGVELARLHQAFQKRHEPVTAPGRLQRNGDPVVSGDRRPQQEQQVLAPGPTSVAAKTPSGLSSFRHRKKLSFQLRPGCSRSARHFREVLRRVVDRAVCSDGLSTMSNGVWRRPQSPRRRRISQAGPPPCPMAPDAP